MMRIFPLYLLLICLLCACSNSGGLGVSRLKVSQSCEPDEYCYQKIQLALDAAASFPPDLPIEIIIGAGDYYEKITVEKDHIRLIGEGKERTRLFFDAVAQHSGIFHRDGWGTAGSATLTINADNVHIESLSIENTFDYLANDRLPQNHSDKIRHSQGVAVLLDVDSDRVHFDDVALIGYQDTLFANGARAYIQDSVISGNIDFVFGNGFVVIENSEIISRIRGQAMAEGKIHSFIAAPSTQISQRFGIVFVRSRLTREIGVPDRSVTLARPWHPTTNFSDGRYADPNAIGHAAFLDCVMDAHIHEQKWSNMSGTARDGTKTAIFTPKDARFEEWGSSGLGRGNVRAANDQSASSRPEWTEGELFSALFDGWSLIRD